MKPRIISSKDKLPETLKRPKFQANQGVWEGKSFTEYYQHCLWYVELWQCTLIFTRDMNHHLGGWWKNPDYERCYHLSVSFAGAIDNPAVTKQILDFLFGDYKTMIWSEPPYSEVGKKMNVWHYRLFCDENWQPIKPRGEVYSREHTEKGWKSFSELYPNPVNTHDTI